MATTDNINYAKYLGINSVAAAVVFAVAYLPLFGWNIRQSIARPTYVFFVLSFFCLIRISAFVIRAVLAGSEAAGETLGLYIADQILFGVGFFGLLYSAYTLVLDRWQLTNKPQPDFPILRITQNRRAFRLILLAAVIIGIIGATKTTGSDPQNGKGFKTASTVIFLVLTILLGLQTLLLARAEDKTGFRTPGQLPSQFGSEHGSHILIVVTLLLLVREAFATATINNVTKEYNEHYWYPLYALPEILAVMLYATPGLVPPRSELPQ